MYFISKSNCNNLQFFYNYLKTNKVVCNYLLLIHPWISLDHLWLFDSLNIWIFASFCFDYWWLCKIYFLYWLISSADNSKKGIPSCSLTVTLSPWLHHKSTCFAAIPFMPNLKQIVSVLLHHTLLSSNLVFHTISDCRLDCISTSWLGTLSTPTFTVSINS